MACCYSGFGGFKGHVRSKGVKLWAHHKTWCNRKVNLRDEPWCNKLPPFRQGITKPLGFLVYPLTLTENLQRLLIMSSVPVGDDVWLDKIKSWISWWRKQALLKMSGNAEPISGNFWWNELRMWKQWQGWILTVVRWSVRSKQCEQVKDLGVQRPTFKLQCCKWCSILHSYSIRQSAGRTLAHFGLLHFVVMCFYEKDYV